MDVDFGFSTNTTTNDMKTDNSYMMKNYFLCFKKLLRIAEIFLILVFFSWLSTRLPFAVRISGEYFRQLLSLILTPLFIFLLGNLIVLTLFFKSRHLIGTETEAAAATPVDMDFDYFVGEEIISSPVEKEAVVFQDKETILEETAANVVNVVKSKNIACKVHKRSQSVDLRKMEKKGGEGSEKKLRRSETDKVRRVAAEEEEEVVDEMSNEEFQRAIEEFIAKQVKFHQEEKLAIVLHNNINSSA